MQVCANSTHIFILILILLSHGARCDNVVGFSDVWKTSECNNTIKQTYFL